jgi:hypothetical protein
MRNARDARLRDLYGTSCVSGPQIAKRAGSV